MSVLRNVVEAVRSAPRVVHWFCGVSVIYAVFAFANLLWPMTVLMYIQMAWIFMLALPLWCKPIAKMIDTKTLWEK